MAEPVEFHYRRGRASWPSKLPCRIAIVGEAPGGEEVVEGKPFIGASGRLLDTWLRAAGIARAACLVTNVFGIHPPNNDLQLLFVKKPEARHIEGWRPRFFMESRGFVRPDFEEELDRLWSELKLAQPNVVLAMGAT